MQHYKNYPIYVAAVYRHGGGWNARGIVFEPKTPTRKLKRFETGETIFCLEKQEAEDFAQLMCQAWIDGLDRST